MNLADYLNELKALGPEKPLEPELKSHRQEHDKKLREEKDLSDGAVMQAVVETGDEESERPGEGDLVLVHVSVRTEDDDLIFSTRSDEGGSGQPLAFCLEKGRRAPRGWEISLRGMHVKQRNVLKVKPSYGYQHPECGMPAPPGTPLDQVLSFDLQLMQVYPAEGVRCVSSGDDMYRRVLQEGSGWESPRPPFEVVLRCTLRTLAYDGISMSGFRYFQCGEGDTPLRAQLGSGQLPPGIEAALGYMAKAEHSVFILPASSVSPAAPPSSADQPAAACLLPAPPAKALQVEAELELLELVQVRDMTGTGEVMKRRIREGQGEFPIDCPLNDTTVRVHYRVRAQAGPPGASSSSSSSSSSEEAAWAYDSRTAGDAAPVEFDTGCGEMPEALEMAVKLMLPGELARVSSIPRYAYEGRPDVPPGISPSQHVEFEVELLGFEKEGHWQTISMEERFVIAERMKGKGNELYKAKKYKYARSRYDRLLRLLNSTRDFENEEQVNKIDALKLAVLSNLALCCQGEGEYGEAVSFCNKALEHDPDSAKLILRRGRALSLKGDYEEAEADLALVKQLEPGSSYAAEAEKELAANKLRAKAAEEKQKKTFRNFFDRS